MIIILSTTFVTFIDYFLMFFEFLLIHWQTILLFLIIAILYSSVGFGGGSSYLAVLAITTLAYTSIRSTALLCNIVVVSGNVYLFQKNKLIDWKKVLPLVAFSIPAAFLGGLLRVNQSAFFIILGTTLLIASFFMIFLQKKSSEENTKNIVVKNISFGSIIGFISGLVGIGGGIFLAPLLHLTNWSSSKKIAAAASFFILANSIAGLFGQIVNPDFKIEWKLTLMLLITVFIGGQIGSRLSNKLLSPTQLKRITAILVAFVGIKILLKYI